MRQTIFDSPLAGRRAASRMRSRLPQGCFEAVDRGDSVVKPSRSITKGEEKMTKTLIFSLSLAASLLAFSARAQDVRQYTDGPVTEMDYIRVEYGHFEEYVDWLNSIWKPTMEATKKAGLILDYKVVRATPKTPDQPNIFLMITYKNMAT